MLFDLIFDCDRIPVDNFYMKINEFETHIPELFAPMALPSAPFSSLKKIQHRRIIRISALINCDLSA